LTALDWVIIAGYLVFSLGIGIAMSRRAGRSMADFFVGGRSLPWWLAGTAMVATTFAADTPLAVTEMVVQHGVAGNWLWWNLVMSGILTVFFYSRLWRRAGQRARRDHGGRIHDAQLLADSVRKRGVLHGAGNDRRHRELLEQRSHA
jgi:Na+/proline symporter